MGEGGREGGGETSLCKGDMDWLPLVPAVTGDGTGNPGMFPDCHSNQRPFRLQDDAQPGEPHLPGTLLCLFFQS